ncbi:hypothetical protein HMH01_03025 [Halovulum dunhuangense]|uniref:Ferrochelatase n=1 Tax=Halovulum dunhuangense TaxID=1505036 RepID=A0A849KZA1_9RHOB|nr:hypothetical protein [Halovulum dunhuangense]NNU79402.1 hypothetical protein [Halovulum dunhuangense]
MKKLALTAAVLFAAAPAFAGNVEVFVAPEEPVVVEEPMGGSNAGWVVPLLAVVVAGVAIAVSE